MRNTTEQYKAWDRRFRRAYKRAALTAHVNRGWRMAQFFADVTPEEAVRALEQRADARR